MTSPFRYPFAWCLALSVAATAQAQSTSPPPASEPATMTTPATTTNSASTTTSAAPATPAPPRCDGPEYRQFDFWVGDWEVPGPPGQPVSHSHVESILAGCVVFENWRGGTGFEGKSFNIYNRSTGHWEQFWVDVSGNRLHLVGGLENGSMVLRGVQDKPDPKTGIVQRERITWTPNPDGTVRQFWETSTDDGKTWSSTFDGTYHRIASPAPATSP